MKDIFVKSAQPFYSLYHVYCVVVDMEEVIHSNVASYVPELTIFLNRYDNPPIDVWFEDWAFSHLEFGDLGLHLPYLLFNSG